MPRLPIFIRLFVPISGSVPKGVKQLTGAIFKPGSVLKVQMDVIYYQSVKWPIGEEPKGMSSYGEKTR